MGLFRGEQRAVTAGQILDAVNARRMGNAAPPVTTDSAMSLSVVWACIRLVAGVGSTLPLDVYRDSAGPTRPITTPPLFRSPTPDGSLTTWLYQVWSSLMTDGNAYGIVTGYGANGFPNTIELVDPAAVSWHPDPDGWVTRIENKPMARWPIGPLWHVPLFTQPGKPYGMSPISAARETIAAGMSAEQFGSQFFSGGGNPNAIVYSDQQLTKEQAEGIKSAFVSATNGREPAVMGSGLKYERIQISPDEAQFIDSQRFTVEQVARIFGVFPEMIGGASSGSSVTYANREQRAADWLTFGFMPYLVPLEAALSSLLPRPQRVKFNVDALLRSDLKTRYESYQIGIGAKFLLPNEARDLEDLPPVEGGDEFAEPAPAPMPSADDDSPEDVPA